MMKIISLMCAVLLAGVVCIVDVRTVYAEDQSIALQIKPLAMPAVTDKGYKGRMTMTPYMEVVSEEAVERLCGRLPRLMDAILLAFEDQPVRLSDPQADMSQRQEALRILVDQTIGTGVFKAFYLVPGSVKRGEGTEMIDLAGAKRECQPIRELPWIVTEAAEAAAVAAMPAPAQIRPPDYIAPSPLSEDELLKAEAELMAEEPVRRPFPGEPAKSKPFASSQVITAVILIGLGGIMMVIGSYIGYQVAKIRRERRREERRQARRDRRSGVDRRSRSDGPPVSGERRQSEDRRKLQDRRKAEDRRTKRDRREEPEPEN
ncbi:hypothetical protein L2D14_08300 [Thalassospiraceae bacterium LMO-JJ14]|nr:hypothetical protein L2D14_08300 [Thalassospiraceae bacterium LMO-JJ14]